MEPKLLFRHRRGAVQAGVAGVTFLTQTPRISVIVTTRNSAGTLEACLRSVRDSGDGVELVVVDNFSNDRTPEIAQRYATVFEQTGPERSRQRNRGAELASAPFLLFLDSDMVVPKEVIADCLKAADERVCAAVIPEVSHGIGFWAACKALERACYADDETVEAARLFDRRLFKRLGGFDEDLTGEEDWDLTARLRAANIPIAHTLTPLIHDEGHLTLSETMRTKFYYGRTMFRYIRKHPKAARQQLRFIRPAFIRNRRLLGAHPARAAGMFLMKACEIAAGATGTAVGMWADRRR